MKPKIPFISRQVPEEIAAWLGMFSQTCPDFDFAQVADMSAAERKAARVALVANPDPAELALLPNLEWVQSLWAGVEGLLQAFGDAPFQIVRMVDPQLAETMAEAVLAWTLYLHRDMPRYRMQQAENTWRQHKLRLPSEQMIGILGLGTLGTHAAKRLRQNGFQVCGWSRTAKSVGDSIMTYHGVDGLGELLKQTSILVDLLPLTDETTGLVNTKVLEQLPRNAAIINFGRGAVVDTEALITQLDNGHLSHAVLDVFETEPLPRSSALWDHPKITVLPHISAPTTTETASAIAAGNLQNYFKTGAIPPAVDRKLGY